MSDELPIGYLLGFDINYENIEKGLIDEDIPFDSGSLILRKINEDDINRLRKYFSDAIIRGVYTVPRIDKYVLNDIISIDTTGYRFYDFLTALRLFQEGDVYYSHILYPSLFSTGPLPDKIHKKYILNYDKICKIDEIYHKIRIENQDDVRYRTAIAYFNKSYEPSKIKEKHDRLIYLMICSEALLLDQKIRSDKGRILGLICSKLIGKNNSERDTIKENFMYAYNVRNRIVHAKTMNRGEVQDEKEWDFIRNISYKNDIITEYLRKAFKKLL